MKNMIVLKPITMSRTFNSFKSTLAVTLCCVLLLGSMSLAWASKNGQDMPGSQQDDQPEKPQKKSLLKGPITKFQKRFQQKQEMLEEREITEEKRGDLPVELQVYIFHF